MLMLRDRARIICIASCLLLSGVFSYVQSPKFVMTVIVIALTGLLSAMIAILTRRICRTPQVQNLKQAVKLLGLVILPVCVLSAGILAFLLQRVLACLMGVGMVLPTLLLLMTKLRARTPNRSGFEKSVLISAIFMMIGLSCTPY